jgi:mitochondrial transcription factor 1
MKLPRSATQAASLATELRTWYRNANTSGARSVVPLQIVNPILCQEVLDRLAPSLEHHKGCVLIDINPGLGLWSRYLHDFLKPRLHLLVEPQRDRFAPHLDPLLNAPDSRYKWTNLALWKIFADNVGDFGSPLPESERHVTENPRILLNASFSKKNIYLKGRLTAAAPSDFFNDVYASLYGLRSDMFRFGLFRSLIWMPDEHKHFVLPRTVDRQSKQSIQFSVSSSLTEVAGSPLATELGLQHTRNYPLLVEDFRAMCEKESGSGIVVPKQRQHAVPARPWEYLHPSVKTWQREDFIDPPVFLPDLLDMDNLIKQTRPKTYKLFSRHWEDLSGKRTPRYRKHSENGLTAEQDPDVKSWLRLYATARRRHAVLRSKQHAVEEQRSLDQAWRAAQTGNDTDLLQDLAIRGLESRKRIDALPTYTKSWIRKAVDDYRAYDTSALNWYRRPYNPLAVGELDFASGWEQDSSSRLALLDLHISPAFRATFATHVSTRAFELLLTRMMTASSASVRTALSQIVPGAVDEFVETVPSLLEATRSGGWNDLDEMRVRALSPELWREIAVAYNDWPFRPDEHRLWHELTIRQALGDTVSMY